MNKLQTPWSITVSHTICTTVLCYALHIFSRIKLKILHAMGEDTCWHYVSSHLVEIFTSSSSWLSRSKLSKQNKANSMLLLVLRVQLIPQIGIFSVIYPFLLYSSGFCRFLSYSWKSGCLRPFIDACIGNP